MDRKSPGTETLSWEEAIALLNANFSFRSLPGKDGELSYRLAPNGKALSIREVNGEIVAELPSRIDDVSARDSGSTGHSVQLRIHSVRDIEAAIGQFRDSVLPASPPKSAAVEPTSNQLRNLGENRMTTAKAATNTILYGPPGTGKTFATAERAVKICDGQVPVSRKELMQRYEVLRLEKRIWFVTFHQSFGYEEFVEGLRPHVNAAGQVSYSIRPGVFREACNAARLRQLITPGLNGRPLRERTLWKMSLGSSQTDEGTKVFQYCLKNQCILLGWGDEFDFSECHDEASIRTHIETEAPQTEKIASQSKFVDSFKHDLKIGDIVVIPSGNSSFKAIAEVTGDYEYVEDAPFHQMRGVKWLAVFEAGKDVFEVFDKKFTMRTLYKLNSASMNAEALSKLLVDDATGVSVQSHVLIIDEINRANISKVFGELITLIEPDKREGELNAITLRLPYSGEDFTIPPNLHLLGTMNTADRSIALLDTAIRRRFDFEELTPDASALSGSYVEGVDLGRMLTSLNQRIEAIFDRDHRIGHAFFIGVKDLAGLEQVFRRKVIPLLQEYFYENWSNVRRVLNDYGLGDFVVSTRLAQLPADGEDSFSEEPRVVYRVNATPFPVAAYQRIYSVN